MAPPYDRDATLAPLVPGRIVFLDARVGEMVSEGAVVARVETDALDDQLKSAEAAARRSEADVAFKRGVAKRSRDLLAKGVASREEAESAERRGGRGRIGAGGGRFEPGHRATATGRGRK